MVRSVGSKAAKIVLIGEAPDRHEESRKEPFVGPSGMRLGRWWHEVGLHRRDFYITNVLPYRPPNNDIDRVPKQEIEAWSQVLRQRITELEDPWIVVPTGNVALKALLGTAGIFKYRGSILPYTDLNGRTMKMIPTVHPAAVGRDLTLERSTILHWRRIKEELATREIDLPKSEYFTNPTLNDIAGYYHKLKSQPSHPVAVDIETSPSQVLCVGYSIDPAFGFTIPTTHNYWGDPGKLKEVWKWIAKINALPNEKVLQWGFYDEFWFRRLSASLANWKWELTGMGRTLYPREEQSLQFYACTRTRRPFWKDEAKDPESVMRYASNFDALLTYNGMDVCGTIEIFHHMKKELEERNLLEFYQRFYGRLLDPILSASVHGIRTDEKRRRKRHAKLIAEIITIQDQLTEIAGTPLYATKDLSSKRVQKFLYETLGLPKQHKRGVKKLNKDGSKPVTADEVTIRKLIIRYPTYKELQKSGPLILDHRRKKKLSEFLDGDRVDEDARVRCSYSFGTYTMRLSSKSNPMGTGANLQNQDREVRDIYIPDEGMVLLEVDLSQAESRVVYVRTGDPVLIDLARRHPSIYDAHRDNATIIFGAVLGRKLKPEEITKDQRYLGKRGVHAGHYGMKGAKLSDELLKDGYVYTAEECQAVIDAYLGARPAIVDWQAKTRREVLYQGCLSNNWGMVLDFSTERVGDDMFREAYAFRPQSEVGILLNQWGFIPMHEEIKKAKMQSRIHLQSHDALLLSTPVEEAYDVAIFLQESLERPRKYNNVELTIPCEFKLGSSWKGDHEFKKLPGREEFTEIAQSIYDKMRREK